MPLTIHLRDTESPEQHTLTIPDYEEITLAQWKAFNPIEGTPIDEEDQYDHNIRRVCLYTGLPESTVERWGSKTFTTVLTHVRHQIERAYQGSDKFKKALAEGTDFVPDPLIIIGGKPYDVPLDMDRVLIAQFADWERWEPPTHEADIVAEALAFMLVEAGEEYMGATADKVEAMRHVPVEQGFDLCAFFFSKSDEFRNVTSLRSRKFQGWTRHLLTTTRRTLSSGTEASTSSTGPLN